MSEVSPLDLKQSRKWQITINNPAEHAFTDDSVKALMSTVKGLSLYWCMHRETAFGACAENRAYVLKDGEKFNKGKNGDYDYMDKSGNHHQGGNFSDTFFAWGTCLDERQGKSSAPEIVVELIRTDAVSWRLSACPWRRCVPYD